MLDAVRTAPIVAVLDVTATEAPAPKVTQSGDPLDTSVAAPVSP